MGITLDGILMHRAFLLHEFRTPEGMDRELLARTIMLKARYFDVLYPNPDDMAFHVKAWAERNFYNWDGLWRSINYNYNIFVNIDYEERTVEKVAVEGSNIGKAVDDGTLISETSGDENGGATRNTHESGTESEGVIKTGNSTFVGNVDHSGNASSDTVGDAGTNTDRNNHVSGTGDTDNSYRGFNSTSHRPVSKQDTSDTKDEHETITSNTHTTGSVISDSDETTDTNNLTVDSSNAERDTETISETDEVSTSRLSRTGQEDVRTGNTRDTQALHAENKAREVIHTMKGDSSVRSAPSVIKEERELFELDVYTTIANDFVHDFCIMIYNF